MNEQEYIPVIQLSAYYDVEISFFEELHETGLIEMVIINDAQHLHHDNLSAFEKICRLHRDLNINADGIATVLLLLQKLEEVNDELNRVRRKLKAYE